MELLKDRPNPVGVLRSKASGEPPLCMSVAVALALKKAVEATRKDRGITDYFSLRKFFVFSLRFFSRLVFCVNFLNHLSNFSFVIAALKITST